MTTDRATPVTAEQATALLHEDLKNVQRLNGLLRGVYWEQIQDINTRAADLLESLHAKNQWALAERDAALAALREIATRLDSAAAEVDCFNVYESRDVARAILAAQPKGDHE